MELLCFLFRIIPTALLIISLPYLLLSLFGSLFRKTFPDCDGFLRYAVIIPARNEGRVIAGAIESIRRADHGDAVDIYVIAHNCTDDTLAIAEQLGAKCFVCNNNRQRTKGFAIRAFVDDLLAKGRLEDYDGFFILDADNLVKKDYFTEMNRAFVHEHGQSVVNAYQNTRNFGDNLIATLYGIYQLRNVAQERRARAWCNISTRLRGTGFLLPTAVLKDGFPYTSLTEDWELCADLVLHDVKITHCDAAEFYEEQPTDFRVMLRQRFRWQAGYLYVIRHYFGRLLKALLLPPRRGGAKRKCSVYDMLVSLIPYPVFIVFNDILFLAAGLVGMGFGLEPKAFLMAWCAVVLPKYLGFIVLEYLMSLRCFYVERRHISGVSLPRKIGTTLLYPFFYLLAFPLQIRALFSKNVLWDEIPHSSACRPDLTET